jgi:Flp pilus assembly pilin Flp
MRSGTSVRRIVKDTEGASLIEFTLVFPLILLVALGTVDAALVLFDHAQGNKAAQRGARVAVVAPPVAEGATDLEYISIGSNCFDVATGLPNGNCEVVDAVCSNGACTGTHTGFDTDAFNDILGEMQLMFPRLDAENVQIAYRSTSLGFSGRPGGVPMEVTVEIRCMTSQLFFLGALMGWVLQSPAGCPNAEPGWQLPPFATTLSSEAMDS